jgi:hypothetical protein
MASTFVTVQSHWELKPVEDWNLCRADNNKTAIRWCLGSSSAKDRWKPNDSPGSFHRNGSLHSPMDETQQGQSPKTKAL